jgi:hypothetical protein
LPPLARLVQAVRDQSNSAAELLDLAFALCEANLEITKEEYSTWQGLCVVDATGVFSLQGLGGDLCNNYGYDFWDFLRAIAELARRSKDPAQYHQCINRNLFSSPADDDLILQRLQSLLASGEPRNLGCTVDTGKLLSSLVPSEPALEQTELSADEITITPRNMPNAYAGYGRSLKLKMDGQVVVRGPFCCDVSLEQPFYWLASVSLSALEAIQLNKDVAISQSGLTVHLSYRLDIESNIESEPKLLLSTTATEHVEAGRDVRHFWVYRHPLQWDASTGVNISVKASDWQSLRGHKLEAYGFKCREAEFSLINKPPVQLIIALQATDNSQVPVGQITLPILRLKRAPSPNR